MFIEHIHITTLIHREIFLLRMSWAYSTLLTARPNEACPASTLASDVVAVCTVLAATDFGAIPAMEA